MKDRLAQGDEHIKLVQNKEEYFGHAYAYYCPLLLLRKIKGKQVAEEFENRHGRLPNKDEFHSYFKSIGHEYDDRAVRFAWKGANDLGKKSFATDEQVVTMAVLHGLISGQETLILTRDHALMDQFYKLLFLIDMHYRCMLFAEKYAAAPHNYRPQNKRTVCEGRPNLFDDRFVGEDDLFMRPGPFPSEWGGWDSLLPQNSACVNLGCVWFGDGPDVLQVAQMTFCADREMSKVLRVKTETGGLNTSLLNGKTATFGRVQNCRIRWASALQLLPTGLSTTTKACRPTGRWI